jgi:8-oxo-dGTP diphosphatase
MDGIEAIVEYACGFLFSGDPEDPEVLLIRKRKPARQAGLLNGVGGLVEPGETPEQAMVREFEEEACLELLGWRLDTVLSGDGFRVSFFSLWVGAETFAAARPGTDEQLERHRVIGFPPEQGVGNLPLLMALALDRSGVSRPLELREELAS